MMKRWRGVAPVLLSILALCLLQTPALADARPTGSALVFGVGSNFRIDSFNGATVAYQRDLRGDLAWRFSVTIELDSGETEYSGEIESESPNTYSEAGDEWDHTISLCSEWLTYRGSEISLYYGGGPRVSYTNWLHSYRSFGFSGGYVNDWNHENSGQSLHLGVTGILGVQWTPVRWCTIHAEYRVVAGYVSESTGTRRWEAYSSNPYTLEEDRTTQGFELDPLGVRVGLSIYFGSM